MRLEERTAKAAEVIDMLQGRIPLFVEGNYIEVMNSLIRAGVVDRKSPHSPGEMGSAFVQLVANQDTERFLVYSSKRYQNPDYFEREQFKQQVDAVLPAGASTFY